MRALIEIALFIGEAIIFLVAMGGLVAVLYIIHITINP